MPLCRVCEVEPCICVKPQSRVLWRKSEDVNNSISREEFGLDLFEAIKTASALQFLKQHHTRPLKQQQLATQLTTLLPRLSEADQIKIAERLGR